MFWQGKQISIKSQLTSGGSSNEINSQTSLLSFLSYQRVSLALYARPDRTYSRIFSGDRRPGVFHNLHSCSRHSETVFVQEIRSRVETYTWRSVTSSRHCRRQSPFHVILKSLDYFAILCVRKALCTPGCSGQESAMATMTPVHHLLDTRSCLPLACSLARWILVLGIMVVCCKDTPIFNFHPGHDHSTVVCASRAVVQNAAPDGSLIEPCAFDNCDCERQSFAIAVPGLDPPGTRAQYSAEPRFVIISPIRSGVFHPPSIS